MDRPIAFLLTSPNGGGAERAMIAVANYFAEHGTQVHFVLGKPDGPFRKDISPLIKIHDLNLKRLRNMLFPLNLYVRSNAPAVVITALPSCDIAALVGRSIFGWNTKILVSVQNHPGEVSRYGKRLLDRYWKLFIKVIYRKSDQIVAISKGVASSVSFIGRGKFGEIPVINNPVITDNFYEKLKSEPSHPWFGKNPVFLAAGRLTAQKDYPTLISAFSEVNKARPDSRLIILGDGEDRMSVEKQIDEQSLKESVFLAGFVENPYCWMKRANVFVLSSRWEGFANVVAESLACGVPVVSTDCPSGPNEILDGGKYGRLVPVGDVKALAYEMLKALETGYDADELMKRGRQFSVDNIAPAYLKLVRGLMSV